MLRASPGRRFPVRARTTRGTGLSTWMGAVDGEGATRAAQRVLSRVPVWVTVQDCLAPMPPTVVRIWGDAARKQMRILFAR